MSLQRMPGSGETPFLYISWALAHHGLPHSRSTPPTSLRHDLAWCICVVNVSLLQHAAILHLSLPVRLLVTHTRQRACGFALSLCCQPSHRLHDRPDALVLPQHQQSRGVADLRNPSAREHLWIPAVRPAYTNAPSAVVHLVVSLRSSRRGGHLFCAVSARTVSPLRVRILGLLLGLMQSGNTGGATLNTCCLTARVSRA